VLNDVNLVAVMTGHVPLSVQWAATQYNGHRAVIPKLALAGFLRLIPDFRVGLYLNAAVLSAAAASAIVLVRRLRGCSRVVDSLLPLAILNLGQCECLLVGFALNLMMGSWISWGLISIVARVGES
jgi:hypothetical protein